MASSSSCRLSSSTGLPISSRRRESTGIAITEYSRRTTSCEKPSRHSRSATSARNARSRPEAMETTVTAPEAAARVRNHPWTSHSWQPPVAADILSASRGRSGKSSHILANRLSRHRCRPLAGRPPTGPSSCRSMTIATSCKPRPTNCPRSIFTASERCRTPGHDKAPRPPDSERLRTDSRKTPRQGESWLIQGAAFQAGAASGDGSNALTSRLSVGQCWRKCHWPGYPLPLTIVSPPPLP